MGTPLEHELAMLVIAVFSRYEQALSWAEEELSLAWGEVALQSDVFPFFHTRYYEKEMGPELLLQFLAFDRLISVTSLAEIKLNSNQLEADYARIGHHPEPRPLNIDPGYLTLGKFVLATTKDASHRLYLDHGIFAEVTLSYAHGKWRPYEWTYPNYREPSYHEFLQHCRKLLYERRQSSSPRKSQTG